MPTRNTQQNINNLAILISFGSRSRQPDDHRKPNLGATLILVLATQIVGIAAHLTAIGKIVYQMMFVLMFCANNLLHITDSISQAGLVEGNYDGTNSCELAMRWEPSGQAQSGDQENVYYSAA